MARNFTLTPDKAIQILELSGITRGAPIENVHPTRIHSLTRNCGAYGFKGKTASARYYAHVQATAALGLPGLPNSNERLSAMLAALRSDCDAAIADTNSVLCSIGI